MRRFYPNYKVEYYVAMIPTSTYNTDLSSFKSSPSTFSGAKNTIKFDDNTYYKDTEYTLDVSGDYALDTTYRVCFLARFKDTDTFGTDWTYIVPYYTSSYYDTFGELTDALTTNEVKEDAGLTSEEQSVYNSTTSSYDDITVPFMKVNGTASATVTIAETSGVEYRIAFATSASDDTVTTMKAGSSSGTTAFSSSTTYTSLYSATVSGSYDIATTYYAYIIVQFTDNTDYSDDWIYLGSIASDSLTTSEIIADAGLSETTKSVTNTTTNETEDVTVPKVVINSTSSATVTIAETSGVEYRVALRDTTDTTDSVISEMKDGTTTNTSEFSASSTYSGLYEAEITGTYSLNTRYYDYIMVKFTSNSNYDSDEWIYLGSVYSNILLSEEIALDKLTATDAKITLENNTDKTGFTLTFPAVAGVTYYYTVIPTSATGYYYTSNYYIDYMVSEINSVTPTEDSSEYSVDITQSYYITSSSNKGLTALVSDTEYKVILVVESNYSSLQDNYSSDYYDYKYHSDGTGYHYDYYYKVDPSVTATKE